MQQEVHSSSREETFHWTLGPPDGTVRGRFYTDGSRLDGSTSLPARNGWSFVAVDGSKSNSIKSKLYSR